MYPKYSLKGIWIQRHGSYLTHIYFQIKGCLENCWESSMFCFRHFWMVLLLDEPTPIHQLFHKCLCMGEISFHFHCILSFVVYLFLQRVCPCSVWHHCVKTVDLRMLYTAVYLCSDNCIWQDVFLILHIDRASRLNANELDPSTFEIFWFTWKHERRKIPQSGQSELRG